MENGRDQQWIQRTDKIRHENVRIKLNYGQETLDEVAINGDVSKWLLVSTVVCNVSNSIYTYFCKNQNPDTILRVMARSCSPVVKGH